MTDAQAINAICSLAALGALGYIAFVAYPRMAVDHFRQRMFTIRDELFDYVADNDINFDHPAHQLLRYTMNGFLRFGDRLGPQSMMVSAIMGVSDATPAPDSRSFEHAFNSAIDGLSNDQKIAFRSFRAHMHRAVLGHLATKSPVFIVAVIAPTMALTAAMELIKAASKTFQGSSPPYSVIKRIQRRSEIKTRSRFKPQFKDLDDQALAFGLVDSPGDGRNLIAA